MSEPKETVSSRIGYQAYRDEFSQSVCAACDQNFTELDRNPKRLNCLHVFCYGCLPGMTKNNQLSCPISGCENKQNISNGGLLKIEDDEIALTNLKKKLFATQPENVKCQGCPDNAFATNFCRQCKYCLCKKCLEAHMRSLMSRDHNLPLLADLKKESDAIFASNPRCTEHGKEMKYFCDSDDCKKTVCDECILFDHEKPAHKVKKLKDSMDEQKKLLSKKADGVKTFFKKVEKGLGGIKKEIKAVEEQKNDLAVQVQSTFQKYIDIFEKRSAQLLEEKEDLSKDKITILEKQKTELESIWVKIDTLVRYCTAALETGDDHAFINVAKCLKGKLETLDTNIKLAPRTQSSLIYEDKFGPPGIQELACFMGSIYDQSKKQHVMKETPEKETNEVVEKVDSSGISETWNIVIEQLLKKQTEYQKQIDTLGTVNSQLRNENSVLKKENVLLRKDKQ